MLKTLPPSTTTQQPHSTLQTDITGAPTWRYINMTSSCFMLVSGEEVVTAGMSRITSQHHCRVVPGSRTWYGVTVFSPWHTGTALYWCRWWRKGEGGGGEQNSRSILHHHHYSSITRQLPSGRGGEHCHWSEDAGLTITPSPPQQLPAQGK